MIVLATGSNNRPDLLAPHVDDEMRVLGQLKAEGVINPHTVAPRRQGFTSSLRVQASRPSENVSTHSLLSSRAS
jgi:hypothetical protein